jgi:hypothetical protein
MAGLTKRVREIVSREPEGPLKTIYAALSDADFRDLNRVFSRLERRGELVIKGKRYRYAPKEGRLGPAQQRIWAAMRNLAKVSRIIDLEDVVLLSGASPDYVRRYAGYLIREGHLAQRRTDGVYVMLAPQKVQAPAWNRRKAEKGESDE